MDTNKFSDNPANLLVTGSGSKALHEAYDLMRQPSGQTNDFGGTLKDLSQSVSQASDTNLFEGSVSQAAQSLIEFANQSKLDPSVDKKIHDLLSTNGSAQSESRRNDVLFELHKLDPEAFQQLQEKEPEIFEQFAESGLKSLTNSLHKSGTAEKSVKPETANEPKTLEFNNPYGSGKWDDSSNLPHEQTHGVEPKARAESLPVETTIDREQEKAIKDAEKIIDKIVEDFQQQGDQAVKVSQVKLEHHNNQLMAKSGDLDFKKTRDGNSETIEINVKNSRPGVNSSYKLQFDSTNKPTLMVEDVLGNDHTHSQYDCVIHRQRDGGIDITAQTTDGPFKYRHKSLNSGDAIAGDLLLIPGGNHGGKVIETYENPAPNGHPARMFIGAHENLVEAEEGFENHYR